MQRKLHAKQTSNESNSAALKDDEEKEVKALEYQHDPVDESQTKQTGAVETVGSCAQKEKSHCQGLNPVNNSSQRVHDGQGLVI